MRAPLIALAGTAGLFLAIIAGQYVGTTFRSPSEGGVDATIRSVGLATRHTDIHPAIDGLFGPYIPAKFSSSQVCEYGAVKGDDGELRLALLVGVGDYAYSAIPDLLGPPRDVEKMHLLLTGENGYGFPEENVCVLLNDAATRKNFIDSFRKALVAKAADGAKIVIYYSGHGSQQVDLDQDESDRMDETWLFHDTGMTVDGVFSKPFVDDEFNVLMRELRSAAPNMNITVILDSCNSGSATRGAFRDIAVRSGPTSEELFDMTPEPLLKGDGGDDAEWMADDGDAGTYVVLAAAGDGIPALETRDPTRNDGSRSGVFTDALFTEMSRATSEPATYADIENGVRRLVQARSNQDPWLYGALDTRIFGSAAPRKPLGWRVQVVREDQVTLGNGPLPGVGEKALFRIYDRSAAASDFGDPARSKAQAEVTVSNGIMAEAAIISRAEGAVIGEGDYAVLVSVAADYRRKSFRLRPKGEPGGLPDALAAALRSVYQDDATAQQLFDLESDFASFELVVNALGDLQILDPEGRIRNTFTKPDEKTFAVIETMRNHARQAAIRQLADEPGSGTNRFGLAIHIKPRPELRNDPDVGNANCVEEFEPPSWEADNEGEFRDLPVCGFYEVWVERTERGPLNLQVGGLHLTADGQMLALPAKSDCELRERFDPVNLTRTQRSACLGVYQALPPMDIEETFMVFGTPESQPVDWGRYATDTGATTRSTLAPASPLMRALDAFVDLRSRSGEIGALGGADSPYAVASLSTRTLINPDCVVGAMRDCNEVTVTEGAREGTREYTIPRFDIRPYMPDDPESALGKVLTKADCLAHYSVSTGNCGGPVGLGDGVHYAQHAWSKPTDRENLAIGIDCSRSIWYAFTRAGLTYNRNNAYLPTKSMVSERSRMADDFSQCTGDYRLGDVLVYRDEDRDVGHVVMVIDPDRRIAWGSHGWDGNIRFQEEPDTGVEYQLIRFKKDWEAWDKQSMRLTSCWRHKRFEAEAAVTASVSGNRRLAEICKNPEQCGVR